MKRMTTIVWTVISCFEGLEVDINETMDIYPALFSVDQYAAFFATKAVRFSDISIIKRKGKTPKTCQAKS